MDVYDFGLLLKIHREKRGLSQTDVAERLNLTKSAISAYEKNVSNPPSNVLKKLAIMYNVSADYLLGLTNRSEILLPENIPEQTQQLIDKFLDFIFYQCRDRKSNKADK